MKLELTEVFFIKQAIEQVTIKSTDAHVVSKVMEKVDREFSRLKKLDDKTKVASEVTGTAK